MHLLPGLARKADLWQRRSLMGAAAVKGRGTHTREIAALRSQQAAALRSQQAAALHSD